MPRFLAASSRARLLLPYIRSSRTKLAVRMPVRADAPNDFERLQTGGRRRGQTTAAGPVAPSAGRGTTGRPYWRAWPAQTGGAGRGGPVWARMELADEMEKAGDLEYRRPRIKLERTGWLGVCDVGVLRIDKNLSKRRCTEEPRREEELVVEGPPFVSLHDDRFLINTLTKHGIYEPSAKNTQQNDPTQVVMAAGRHFPGLPSHCRPPLARDPLCGRARRHSLPHRTG